jgi:phosphoserine phosphatase RsbU/P
MSGPTPPRGTTTTLRALPRALVVGPASSGGNGVSMVSQVENEGYLVFMSAQADDALGRLKAAPFELVLIEIDGLGDDAPRFVETLRQDAQLANLAVLAHSSSDDIAAIERCIEKGADDYLPNAFGPAMLRARLSAALDRRQLHDAQSLRHEMTVARNIQRDFLPESLPEAEGVQLEAALHPARQVSGDFYDAFQLQPSGNIVLVVGDVCDKGVGAALFMALFRSLIRASADPVGGGAIQMIGGRRTLVLQSLESATPEDLLTRVAGFTNNYIARLHGRTNMFATVFMAVLHPYDGELVYLNAGHEPALVIAPDGSTRELRPTGPALGMMPDVAFKAVSGGALAHGHSLLAFTDGLVEARSPSGEAFGSARLREVLAARGGVPAPELVKGVVESLKAFTRQAEPHDDLTMLAASR